LSKRRSIKASLRHLSGSLSTIPHRLKLAFTPSIEKADSTIVGKMKEHLAPVSWRDLSL
jgi:hypothetical protein